MNKNDLINLIKAAGNSFVLKYYNVLTFEELSNRNAVPVEALTEGLEDWEYYGGKIVGYLEVRGDLDPEVKQAIVNAGQDTATIWESGACAINFQTDGILCMLLGKEPERWVEELTVIKQLEEA